jgi:E3 ubiquitin-protein ligase HECTD4
VNFQLLGITIRADIPLGLDLLTVAWRTLVGLTPDTCTDLQEADPMTYAYLKKIEMVSVGDKCCLCFIGFVKHILA